VRVSKSWRPAELAETRGTIFLDEIGGTSQLRSSRTAPALQDANVRFRQRQNQTVDNQPGYGHERDLAKMIESPNSAAM